MESNKVKRFFTNLSYSIFDEDYPEVVYTIIKCAIIGVLVVSFIVLLYHFGIWFNSIL